MKDSYFINIAIEEAIRSYFKAKDNKLSIEYNSFLVVVIRILVLIYGEPDIVNPFRLNNEVAFLDNLCKFGVSRADVALFKEELLNYYNFDKKNNMGKVKCKNPYFKSVLKFLVDMFVAKKKQGLASYQDEEKFLELAYTSHTKNPYRISYNYLYNEDSAYIEKYYYSQLNEIEMTRDLTKTISSSLNLEALNYVGVNLSNLNNMSSEEISKAQNDAYKYFQVDVSSPTREKDLEEKMDFYKAYGNKVTTGNGYVDILLLMSVIVTSFSVIAIIVFSLM